MSFRSLEISGLVLYYWTDQQKWGISNPTTLIFDIISHILGRSENILSGLMKLTFNQNVAFSKVSVVFQIENIIIVFRVESYHC